MKRFTRGKQAVHVNTKASHQHDLQNCHKSDEFTSTMFPKQWVGMSQYIGLSWTE